jgi:type I restriction enzyme, S subunit
VKFIEYELGELGEIITGKTPKKSNSSYYDSNEVLFIKPDDMTVNNIKYISTANEFVSSQGAATGRIVGKGTVLVTCIGIIGKIGIVDADEAIFNQQINAIIPNENLILGKYLAYVLHSMQKILQDKANAPIVPIINKSDFSKIKVLVPDLEYQKRVIKVLDESQELINKRQSQIAALDELMQSVFLEMFGDPVVNNKNLAKKKLGETGELKRGMSKHRPRNAPELLGGPYPLIQTGDVSRAGLFIENFKSTYSELGLKQSKMWEAGTLCITIAANIAETSILKFDSCFPDSVVGYKPFENMNTIFVHYWFSFFQKILESSAPESAQKNINLKILNDIEIITPSIDQQNEFASKVMGIYEQKGRLEKAKNYMEELYNSLLLKAFKGELFKEQKLNEFVSQRS